MGVRDPTSLVWRFMLGYAMFFGYSSAVIQFGRYSKFLEALGRRIGQLLWSMYVDDGSLQDGRTSNVRLHTYKDSDLIG